MYCLSVSLRCDATRRRRDDSGAVKSRKARNLTPPRKQRLPQIRCKHWRHDDAPRVVARDDKHAAHVAAPQWAMLSRPRADAVECTAAGIIHAAGRAASRLSRASRTRPPTTSLLLLPAGQHLPTGPSAKVREVRRPGDYYHTALLGLGGYALVRR